MKASLFALLAGLILLRSGPAATAATTNIYLSQFEAVEGYSTASNLVGQVGWLGQGTGGNGILTNGFVGQGRAAYLGYAPPNPTNYSLAVYRPINFNPIVAGYPIVKFSVLMNITDSEFGYWDIFRWSVYNTQGRRLFSLDFDNDFRDISYVLDGTNQVVFTGLPFVNDSNYTLNVTMNFASNRWSATYNNTLIATNQFITTTNAQLTFGDVDAVWLIHQLNNTNAPGDNYMIFDNYRLTAETLPVVPVTPAQVQFLGRTGEGWALLRVFGDNNSRWSLDATTNFVNWTAVKTNVISGTYADVVDNGAAGLARRFYRARNVP